MIPVIIEGSGIAGQKAEWLNEQTNGHSSTDQIKQKFRLLENILSQMSFSSFD